MIVRFSSAALEEVENAISKIKAFPLASRIILGDYRRSLLSHFPFGIIYRIHQDQIYVVAVMHLKRKPGYWKSRA